MRTSAILVVFLLATLARPSAAAVTGHLEATPLGAPDETENAEAVWAGPLTPPAALGIAFAALAVTGGGGAFSLGIALFDPTERKSPRVVQYGLLGGGGGFVAAGLLSFFTAAALIVVDATVFAE